MPAETPRWNRIASGLVLLLHLLVVGMAPLADAYLEAAARVDYTHIEAEHEFPCAPSHDHLFCQVCRVVDHCAAPGGASPMLAIATVAAGDPLPSQEEPPGRGAPVSSLGSRAPPLG